VVRVKICGICDAAGADMAAESGADLLGFHRRSSRRRVTPEEAKAIIDNLAVRPKIVGVFIDQPEDEVRQIAEFTGLDLLHHHGSEAPGGRDGLQSRHSGADHQHLRGANGAGRCGEHGKKLLQLVGREQHCLVTGDRRLRGQRVHRLRADHFLRIHRHQVAEHHAGRAQEHFAERDGRKIERQAA